MTSLPSTSFRVRGVSPRRDEWPLNRWRGVIVERTGDFTHSSFWGSATTPTVMAGLVPGMTRKCGCAIAANPLRPKFLRQHQRLTGPRDIRPVAVEIGHQPL